MSLNFSIILINIVCTSEILNTAHLTPFFDLPTLGQHKNKWILCTEKPVFNASFQDL